MGWALNTHGSNKEIKLNRGWVQNFSWYQSKTDWFDRERLKYSDKDCKKSFGFVFLQAGDWFLEGS